MTPLSQQPNKGRLLPSMVGSIGVVFGDIGTSPLYAVKEALGGEHAPVITPDAVLGIISLILWTLIVVLTVKYQLFIMRAGHQGEGGSLVLVELARKFTKDSPHMQRYIIIVGMIGVSFFLGDGVITPAISVLSAVEGLEVETPALEPYVIPVTLIVLFLLFFFQSKGTAKIGRLFGPICIIWFLAIALIGLKEIVKHPEILAALNPYYGLKFLFAGHGGGTFVVLGSVFLAVTGAEALYADMGHFGKSAINWSWGILVMPALFLNYLGQGALILGDPTTVKNPFFLSVPDWGLLPMVILATAATIIASQAVISGAFSATRQAMRLGYLPRLRVVHTSSFEFGQIYVPVTNWLLLIAVIFLVLGFKNSHNLAAAYGIAVSITMITDTTLAFGIVLRNILSLSWIRIFPLLLIFLTVDLGFLGALLPKIPDGGWFSMALGVSLFFLMSTWRKGQNLVGQAVRKMEIPLKPFLQQFEGSFALNRMPGTAVFMTQNPQVAPSALVELMKHTNTLYENVIFLGVQSEVVPYVTEADRLTIIPMPDHFYRIKISYGFMETVDVPKALAQCFPGEEGKPFFDNPWFFMGRPTFVAGNHSDMARWRMQLFLDMYRNAESAPNFFNLPPLRVVDLGTRIVLEGS